MSTTSTIAAFRAALVSALQEDAAVVADGIQVADGWQGPDTEDEGIYLTDLRFTNELIAFKGDRQPRVENYEQSVVIQAWQAGSSPQEMGIAVARVVALFEALENVVAEAVDLADELSVQVSSGELITVPAGPSWAARLTVQVLVSADLI